jgi:hypothetical protein
LDAQKLGAVSAEDAAGGDDAHQAEMEHAAKVAAAHAEARNRQWHRTEATKHSFYGQADLRHSVSFRH